MRDLPRILFTPFGLMLLLQVLAEQEMVAGQLFDQGEIIETTAHNVIAYEWVHLIGINSLFSIVQNDTCQRA